MLPFMAQGAAQAIEDGAALAACLTAAAVGRPGRAAPLRGASRRAASRIQALSAVNKIRFHLPDGPEQQERDAQMASGSTDWSIGAIAWIYGHDSAAVDDPGSSPMVAAAADVPVRPTG